ncbi:GDSL esterase/lipase LIP-4-like isoform X2 [Panicum virgatum]|uniref:GDSL esterase/lipase LIP-4-like isoform X2 n=1 Tax=Panicum virgatum TaxID=38727 RepID=UPI0019D5DFBD|nr:GDSL esterase/lipase LIP-4-like isoform X2 [Panicum virgatum]
MVAAGGTTSISRPGGGAAAAAAVAVLVVSALAARTAYAGGQEGDDEPAGAACARRPVVFAFGDSNTDTGGVAAGLGYYYPLPEGRAFFRRATGRLCDGRLVIDYLCESLNMSYLSPYLEALGSDFTGGANFAVSGSATLPRSAPFSLHVQVQQFLHFKQRSFELLTHGGSAPVDADGFRNALYLIDIGQNDLSAAFGSGAPYDDIVHNKIPAFIAEIKDAIMTLHYNGAKNFWVHGTGPLGCLPQKLAAPRPDDGDLDDSGCLKTLNDGAYEFNNQLCAACDELRSQLRGATVVYTDVLLVKYDLVANHSAYGFEEPLMACCGYGGPPYNYNANVSCLGPGFRVCEDGAKFVSWDGVHYTDAANAVVAAKISSGEFSTPKLPFDYFCKA